MCNVINIINLKKNTVYENIIELSLFELIKRMKINNEKLFFLSIILFL